MTNRLVRGLRRCAWMAAAVFALLATAAPGRADLIAMKNGTLYAGDILEETREAVRIRTKVSGILATLTLKRSEIESIQRTGVTNATNPTARPSEAMPGLAEPPSAEPGEGASETPGNYIVVPVVGAIGEQATANGLRAALSAVRSVKVPHIVLGIDTPGGIVSEANEMVDLLEEHRATMRKQGVEVRIHALIDNAISAGIWLVAASDNIFVLEGATLGGAVAFSRDATTGEAEVDAKMNSILAARLATLAQRNGHNPDVIRSMMLMESCLYTWEDRDGKTVAAGERPRDIDKAEITELDGRTTVLTLTGEQATQIGFARPAGAVADLGEALGLPEWKPASRVGVAAMKRGEQRAEEAARIVEEHKSIVGNLGIYIAEAQRSDPHNFTYGYDKSTGQFTESAIRQWRAKTDESIKAWTRVRDAMKDLQRLERRYANLTEQKIEYKKDEKVVMEFVNDQIDRLKKERGRTGI